MVVQEYILRTGLTNRCIVVVVVVYRFSVDASYGLATYGANHS